MPRLQLEVGDRLPQRLQVCCPGRLLAAHRLQLGLALAEPLGQGDQLGAGADRRLFGGDPTALLLGEQPPGVPLGSLLLATFDESADVVLPTGFLTQPGDADLVDQLRNRGRGEPGAELRVTVDDSPHAAEGRSGEPLLFAEQLDVDGTGTGGLRFCQAAAVRTANSSADRR